MEFRIRTQNEGSFFQLRLLPVADISSLWACIYLSIIKTHYKSKFPTKKIETQFSNIERFRYQSLFLMHKALVVSVSYQ